MQLRRPIDFLRLALLGMLFGAFGALALTTFDDFDAEAMTRRYEPAPIASLLAPATITPIPGPIRTVSLHCDVSCTAMERAEVPAIEAKLNETLHSSCFTQYFKTPGRRIDNANNLMPDQILSKLREPTTLTLSYYYQKYSVYPFITKAEGYESAQDFSVIHFNRFKTQSWRLCQKSSLGAHELTHTKLFWHNGNLAPPNYFTVPYQTNNAFEGNDDMPACCKEAA